MKNEPEVIHRRDDMRNEDIPDFVKRWYGWASPIGLGLFLIMLAVVAVLIRFAVVGWR